MPAGALAVLDAVLPMAGRWAVADGALRFVPSLPFAGGTAYALVRAGGGGPARWTELARLLRPGADPVPTAGVTAIDPDVDEVPENLLRLSLTFSAPMEEGGAGDGVRLEDPAGDEIAQALLPMPPELWDAPRRRLTLLLEPGRIKRGLVPNRALGAPLARIDVFDVVVDAAVRDAAGAGLTAAARRSYRVGPPVRSRVEPALWDVVWPSPATRDALVVVFERPLDRALALRCIGVVDERGRALPGAAALGRGAVRWTFRPAAPWPTGGVRLRIDTALEDLAGNSVRRVFDRDLRLGRDDPVDAAEVHLAPGPR